VREMTGSAPNKTTVAIGVLALLVGCVPLLAVLGILPHGQEPADPAPAWMGWVIGAVFVGAGFLVIMRGVWGGADETSGDLPAGAPRALRMVNDAIGVATVCGLAALFSWVAFGPGPRHFSVDLDGLWMRGFGGSDTIGRIAFGFGAILFWCVTGAFALVIVRRWRQ
jgi:amino acid transporter